MTLSHYCPFSQQIIVKEDIILASRSRYSVLFLQIYQDFLFKYVYSVKFVFFVCYLLLLYS